MRRIAFATSAAFAFILHGCVGPSCSLHCNGVKIEVDCSSACCAGLKDFTRSPQCAGTSAQNRKRRVQLVDQSGGLYWGPIGAVDAPGYDSLKKLCACSDSKDGVAKQLFQMAALVPGLCSSSHSSELESRMGSSYAATVKNMAQAASKRLAQEISDKRTAEISASKLVALPADAAGRVSKEGTIVGPFRDSAGGLARNTAELHAPLNTVV